MRNLYCSFRGCELGGRIVYNHGEEVYRIIKTDTGTGEVSETEESKRVNDEKRKLTLENQKKYDNGVKIDEIKPTFIAIANRVNDLVNGNSGAILNAEKARVINSLIPNIQGATTLAELRAALTLIVDNFADTQETANAINFKINIAINTNDLNKAFISLVQKMNLDVKGVTSFDKNGAKAFVDTLIVHYMNLHPGENTQTERDDDTQISLEAFYDSLENDDDPKRVKEKLKEAVEKIASDLDLSDAQQETAKSKINAAITNADIKNVLTYILQPTGEKNGKKTRRMTLGASVSDTTVTPDDPRVERRRMETKVETIRDDEKQNALADGYSAEWNTIKELKVNDDIKGHTLTPKKKEEVQFRDTSGKKIRPLTKERTIPLVATGNIKNVVNIDFAEVKSGDTMGYVALHKMDPGAKVESAPVAPEAAQVQATPAAPSPTPEAPAEAPKDIEVRTDFNPAASLPEALEHPIKMTAEELASAINTMTSGVKNGMYPFIDKKYGTVTSADGKSESFPNINLNKIKEIINADGTRVVGYIEKQEGNTVTYISQGGVRQDATVNTLDVSNYSDPDNKPNEALGAARVAYLANLYEVLNGFVTAKRNENVKEYQANTHKLTLITDHDRSVYYPKDIGNTPLLQLGKYSNGTTLAVVAVVSKEETDPKDKAKKIDVVYYEVIDEKGDRSYIKPNPTEIAAVEPASVQPLTNDDENKPEAPKTPEILTEDRYHATINEIPKLILGKKDIYKGTGIYLALHPLAYSTDVETDDKVLSDELNRILPTANIDLARIRPIPTGGKEPTIGMVIEQDLKAGTLIYLSTEGKKEPLTLPKGDDKDYMSTEDWTEGDLNMKNARTQFLRDLYGNLKARIEFGQKERLKIYENAPKFTVTAESIQTFKTVETRIEEGTKTRKDKPDAEHGSKSLLKIELSSTPTANQYKAGEKLAVIGKVEGKNEYRVLDAQGRSAYIKLDETQAAMIGKDPVQVSSPPPAKDGEALSTVA